MASSSFLDTDMAGAAEDDQVREGVCPALGRADDVMDLEVLGLPADPAAVVAIDDLLAAPRRARLVPGPVRWTPDGVPGAPRALRDAPATDRAEALRHYNHPKTLVGGGSGAVALS
jgi:hypothetical protein